MVTTGTDIDALTEAELLVLPQSIIPSGSLTKFWALHAAVLQKENADELARELTGASHSHRMTGGVQNAEEREEERERHYEQALRQVRERENILLARIEEEERLIEKRRQEIDDNAIRLHDGRRVYVDGQHYRDGQGRVLEGDDENEAGRQHRDNPHASTWQEKSEADKRWEELHRMRRDIEQGRSREGQGSQADQDANVRAREGAIARDEQALARHSEDRTVALEANTDEGAYSLDYAAQAPTGSQLLAVNAGGVNEGLKGVFAANARPAEAAPASSLPIEATLPPRRAGGPPPRNG